MHLTKLLEYYVTHYEKVVTLGDINLEAENKLMNDLRQEQMLYNMMKHVLKESMDFDLQQV